MCYDLLDLEGNKYVYEVSRSLVNSSYLCYKFILMTEKLSYLNQAQVQGKNDDNAKKKEVILEEQDLVWHELRHSHIADVWFPHTYHKCISLWEIPIYTI